VNALDEDPPLTRNEYSYDPFTASPLGRVFKLGLRQAF
jgi:iron complex outermembrane receptor protein